MKHFLVVGERQDLSPFDFSNAFCVLGSAHEWPSAFGIKPIDLLAVCGMDRKEVVRQVVEGLKESGNTWVYLRRFLSGVLLTGCLVMVPMGAHADEGASDALTPSATVTSNNTATNMPELTVIGNTRQPQPLSDTKYSGPLNETPQTATVIDQTQMQEQGITSLRDALRDVSGISLAAGEFSQQGDTLTIRGFSINHDFFLDGMRDYGSYYRDPFFLSEVEVLQGPSGLLFGDGTTGGVVNQVSKQPSLTPSIEGSLEYGTDNTRRETADINEPIPALGSDTALRLDVMDDQNNVTDRNDAENSLGGIAPTLEFGIGTPTRLTLSYVHEDENSTPDYGIPWLLNAPAPVPQQNYYGFLNNYLETSVDLESMKFNHDFDDNLSVQDQARYGNYYRNVQITEPQIAATTADEILEGTLSLNNATVTPNELAVYSTETSFDNQSDLTGKFKTAGIVHTFDVGAEEDIETSNPVRTTYTSVPTQNLMDPNEDLNFSGVGTVSSVTSASVTTLATYALDTIDLDQNWEVIGGLRFDNIDSVYQGTAPSEPVTNLSQTVNVLNWRAGLVYKPQENASIYFVSGTSTDPSAENLSLSSTTDDLAPEQTTSFELGTKWGVLNNKLNLTASAFWEEMDNAQVEDPDDPTLLVDAGTELAKGFDLGVQGYITPEWEVTAEYTFLDSEYLDYVTTSGDFDGYALRNAPQDTVDFWSGYDLTSQFQIGAGLDAVTDRNGGKFVTMPNGALAMEDVPGYITFNAMAKYKLNSNISLQANCINLGNAYYIDEVHPGHIVPGEGRTVLVSTNFKF